MNTCKPRTHLWQVALAAASLAAGCGGHPACPNPDDTVLHLNAPMAQLDAELGTLLSCAIPEADHDRANAVIMLAVLDGTDTLRGRDFINRVKELPEMQEVPGVDMNCVRLLDRPARRAHWPQDSTELAACADAHAVRLTREIVMADSLQWLSYGTAQALWETRRKAGAPAGRNPDGWCGEMPDAEVQQRMPLRPPFMPYASLDEARACAAEQHKLLLVYCSEIISVSARKFEEGALQRHADLIASRFVTAVFVMDDANPLPDKLQPGDGLLSVGEYAHQVLDKRYGKSDTPRVLILNEGGEVISDLRGEVLQRNQAFGDALREALELKH